MKHFVYTVLAIVIASNALFAWQDSPNRLALSLYQHQNERKLKEIPHFQLLEETDAPDLYTRSLPIVKQVTTAKSLGAPIARLLRNRPELVEISIPWQDSLVRIQLFADQPYDQGLPVKTSDGASSLHNALHYRGILKDDDQSLAAISIFEDQIIGIVSSAEVGNLVIGQWAGKAGDHVIYREADLLIQHQTDCVAELAEGRGSDRNTPTAGKRQNGDCVKVYFEVAHSLYKAKGSNVENVTNYVSGLFNVVSTIFDNEGISIEMSELYVWTSADPFSHGSSLSALNTFRANRPSFRGDLGHLLDYTNNELGGRAYIDVLCDNSSNYAYSDIDLNYTQFPTYSWTVNVVAHEIGHNLGSLHTHACAWGSSGNRALDNCFAVEGNCSEGPDPGQSGGTIMSYCHLGQGNPGVNFINGFGPEPGDLIRQKVAQAACLTECGSDNTGGVCNLSITNVQVTNASCGQNNGRLSIQVSGTSGVVTYDIGTGPQTSNTFQNLAPGVYTISVDNGASCERFTTATVAMMSSPPSIQAIVTNATCSRADGKIELSVSGGKAPFRYNLGQGTQNNAIFSGLSAGDYQAQVTDANGCTSSRSITVFTEDAPELTVEIDHTTCGLDNGVISLSVDGGQSPYRYILNEDHYQSGSFESLPPGTYNVGIEDANGCTDEQQLSIAASDPIEAEVLQTPTTCGLDNGTFQVVADGGRAPLTYSLGGPFTPNAVFNALPSGSYQITVRDADNCRVQFAESIAPSDGLDAEIEVSSTQCGQDNGVISLNPKGKNGPFTFGFVDQPVQEDSIFSDLKAGSYEVMVWDQVGCQRSYAVTVDSSSSPIAEMHTKHTTCGQTNGLIEVQVSGGVRPYEFDFGEGFYQDSVLTDLAPGQYHLRVRDQTGCLDSVSSMIDASQPLQTKIVVEGTTCGEANGIVSFERQSGLQPFHYQLGDTTRLDSVITQVPAGEYTVIIVDAAGCTQKDRINVDSSPSVELLTEVQSTTCGREDGALNLFAAGGTGKLSYALDSTFTDQKEYSGLPAGRYQVSVRDEMDCVVTEEVQIMSSTKPKLHVEVTHTRCGDNNAHLELAASGGIVPFQFSLDGQPLGTEVGDLAPGSYTVMVEDSMGCKDSTITDILPSSAPQLDYKVWPAVCNQANGKIIVEGSGGNAPYQFISQNVALKDTVLDQLESGWYSIGLIDAAGCLDSLSIEVPYDARFQPPELVGDLPICDSDPAVLSTGLSDSVELRWFFNGQELQEVAPVLLAHEPGIYQVEAIYNEQCKLGAETRVFQRDKPKVSLVSKDAICLGQAFEVDAASDSLTYRWSNDSIGQRVYFQYTDYYTLTVTDSVGCTQEALIDLEVIPPLQLSSELDDYRVCEGKALEIETWGAESYLWSAPGLSFEPGSSQQSIVTEQDVVIQVIGFNACFSDTLELFVGVNRQMDFLPSDTMIIEGSPLRIATPVAGEVSWLSDYTIDCDSCSEVQVRPEESGSITLNYLDQQGCHWEETFHVEVIPLASIFPQLVNVITPNGDGYNDILILPGLHEFDQVGIEVFDTHGSKVYEDRDYDNDWNGTMNGQSLNEGIYFYILTLRLDDRVFRLDSDLTVIR